MPKKEQLRLKVARQEEIVNAAKAANNRNLTDTEQVEFDSLQRDIDTLKREIEQEEREQGASNEAQRKVNEERQRVLDISTICREFGIEPETHIKSGATMDQVRAAVLEEMKKRNPPSIGGNPDVRVTGAEADKIREAASDALLMRAGKTIEKPADGARDFRGMTLRDLAVDCLLRAGKVNAHRLDNDTLYREVLTPDSQFASLLSSAVGKSMAISYKEAETTYQIWSGRGSNPDFKASTHYQISEAGALSKMTQSGEFKSDEMQDNGVSKAVATFGKEWGINRQAMINDDIGILTKIPESYVRAAKRGINKLVYQMLGSNPAIYDGQVLFHADHGNLAGANAAIGVDSLSLGRAAMRVQKNMRGLETLNIPPKFLLVPATKETLAFQYTSQSYSPAEQSKISPFAGLLTPVVDAELDGYSTTAWYLAAAPGNIDTIEVTYLNGDDMPKLESMVGFDFLGMKWRIYIDYGVTILDFRGMYKNVGV